MTQEKPVSAQPDNSEVATLPVSSKSKPLTLDVFRKNTPKLSAVKRFAIGSAVLDKEGKQKTGKSGKALTRKVEIMRVLTPTELEAQFPSLSKSEREVKRDQAGEVLKRTAAVLNGVVQSDNSFIVSSIRMNDRTYSPVYHKVKVDDDALTLAVKYGVSVEVARKFLTENQGKA